MSYAGKLLRIHLTKKLVSEEPIDLGIAEKFIGGRGYAAKILFDELTPKVNPFSPENKIVFMTGPLTGLAPASDRCAVLSKSPFSGTLFDSNIGGRWGGELKRAGYDGMVVEGKCKEPVYISIEDSRVELRDASQLWGKDTSATAKVLKKGEGKASALCIGPAGENLVKLAIMVDDACRVAGRGGLGAVMGSKNLKAIAVKGSGEIRAADERDFRIHLKRIAKPLAESKACATCLTACSRAKGIERGRGRGKEAVVTRANRLCNDLGLDMLSVGRALGIMKSSERDLLRKGSGPGGAGVSRLIEDIAHGREMPALIADGSVNNGIMRERDDISAVIDSLGLCRFAAPIDSFNFDGFAKVLNSATGFSLDGAELRRAGERICGLERRFNARELEKH